MGSAALIYQYLGDLIATDGQQEDPARIQRVVLNFHGGDVAALTKGMAVAFDLADVTNGLGGAVHKSLAALGGPMVGIVDEDSAIGGSVKVCVYGPVIANDASDGIAALDPITASATAAEVDTAVVGTHQVHGIALEGGGDTTAGKVLIFLGIQ